MSELANYDEQVYAGVLGKVIGVYMGRPFEGWSKDQIAARWGLVDRYVADERGLPLVVADDDISGTFTFIRALEDSGLYAETPPEHFGRTWLNYLIENKTILWWGGMGVSTEHTAYLRLKSGVPSPESGSAALNGRIVSEQIGAQIFIDGFGLVAPGEPELAARLARRAAQVSHDGEAVNGAVVVAAMVAAAFVEKDMGKLLDIGVSTIDPNSIIVQVHRDVRAWCREDGDWERTYERIADKYGYRTYGGGCHMIPNHALMVMAWSYAPDDFRRCLAIVNTAGWDTDCNSGNVGCLMGVKLGLGGLVEDYDFRSPFADRMLLPTAEGSRHVSDCLQEALHIARIGRRIMGWPEIKAPKDGAWHHFSMPGSCHGYLVEPTSDGSSGAAAVENVLRPDGGRALRITYSDLVPNRPLRVSTPVLAEPTVEGYAVVGAPRLYADHTVSVEGRAQVDVGKASLRLFLRVFSAPETGCVSNSTHVIHGESLELTGEAPFVTSLAIPDTRGFPVEDFGLEISGESGAGGRVLVDSIRYSGAPELHIPDELPRSERGTPLGWVADLDALKGAFSHDKHPMTYFGKNRGRGVLVTGTDDWADCAISCRFAVHCAEGAGLVARYQGLQRFIALMKTRERLRLILNYYGDRILDEIPCQWEAGELHLLGLQVRGNEITAMLDNSEVLRGRDEILGRGGAGYVVDTGLAGFRETTIRCHGRDTA